MPLAVPGVFVAPIVVGAQPAGVAMPERASVQLKVTVTGVMCQPLAPFTAGVNERTVMIGAVRSIRTGPKVVVARLPGLALSWAVPVTRTPANAVSALTVQVAVTLTPALAGPPGTPLPEVLVPAHPGVTAVAIPVPASEQVNVMMTLSLVHVLATYGVPLGDSTAVVTLTVGGWVSTTKDVLVTDELSARSATVTVMVAVPSWIGAVTTSYVYEHVVGPSVGSAGGPQLTNSASTAT